MKFKHRSDLKATIIVCLIFFIPVSMLLFGSIIVSVDALREPLQRFVFCRCSDESDVFFRYSDGGTVRKPNDMNKETGTTVVQLECKDCNGSIKIIDNDTVAVTGIVASFVAGAIPGLIISIFYVFSSLKRIKEKNSNNKFS